MARKLKIMLSSIVYGYQPQVESIYNTLIGYGYDVLCSHMGTIYNIPGQPPLNSCLQAVEDCDFFFGVIFPNYGSGITHKEILKAIELEKPRGFLVHANVPFAKQLLKQFMYDDAGARTTFTLKKKTRVMDDLKVIDMYNDAIGDGKSIEKRLWAHQFYNYEIDGSRFVKKQFENYNRLENDLSSLK